MKTNTALDEMSRDVAPQPDEAEIVAAGRLAMVAKAFVRFETAFEQIATLTEVVGQLLPLMAAESPLGDAVNAVSDMSAISDRLDKLSSEFKGKISFVKEVGMPERMDRDKATTFNTDRFRVTRTNKVYASIISEKLDEAYEWLRKSNLGALIKETVNSSSLSATAKELMESGNELPDDIFRTHTKASISITKKK